MYKVTMDEVDLESWETVVPRAPGEYFTQVCVDARSSYGDDAVNAAELKKASNIKHNSTTSSNRVFTLA